MAFFTNIRKIKYLYYVIIWWLLSSGIFLFTYFPTTNQLVLKVVIPLLFLAIIVKEKVLSFDKGLMFYCGLFIWACLSVFYTVNINMALEYLQMLLGNIIIWYIAARCVKKISSIRVLLYPLLFSFLVQLYFALTAKIHIALNPTNRGLERITGLSKNANDEGRLLVFGIVTLLLLINYIKNRTFKVAAIILIGCFYYAIFRTGSRSSLLAVTLMFLSYIFLLSKKKNYGLLIATIAGIFLIYHFSYDYILNNTSMGRRLELAAAHGEQNVRILLIKEGWQFFLSRPIIGLGLGSFTAYSTGNYYSHNDYIEILASLGLPAFLLYMSIFYDYWKKGIKIFQHVNVYYKSAIVVSLAFLFGYLALGIWDPSFYFPTTTLMLAFFYSLIIKMYQFLFKDKHRVKYLIKQPLEIVKTDV